VEFPGAILFRREQAAAAGPAHGRPLEEPALAVPVPVPVPVPMPSPVPPSLPPHAGAGPEEARARARALADQGRLADALRWCDQWLAGDRLAAGAHHLRAMVLIEQGEREAARSALQKALYLVPGFVLAHFALGQLDLQRGAEDAARRHFARAEHALRSLAPDDLVPESDGLTAGAFAQTLRQLAAQRAAP
jgi:tetratricopeptide (TPR) repeat protein